MPRKNSASFSSVDYKKSKSSKQTPEIEFILESPRSHHGIVKHLPPNGRRHSSATPSFSCKERLSSWQRFDDSDEAAIEDSGNYSMDERSPIELLVNDVKCDFTIGEDNEDDENHFDVISWCSDESVFSDSNSEVVVSEKTDHQLSPLSRPKLRSGSLGVLEVSSIKSNPFLLQDQKLNGSENVGKDKILKRINKNGILNESLSDDCDVNNGILFRNNGLKSPKVVIQPIESEDEHFEFDGNNNRPKDSISLSSELLTWYNDIPPSGKSASLPRKLPPPPASPRSRHRLPTSPSANPVSASYTQKISPLFFDNSFVTNKGQSPGLHTVKGHRHGNSNKQSSLYRNYSDIVNRDELLPNNSIRRNHSDVSVRSSPNSPNKSATLPPSHRLSPNRTHSLQYSASDCSSRSQPSSPGSHVRRTSSLLSSPSFSREKASSYKNLGGFSSLNQPGSKFEVQSSRKSNKGSRKRTEWRPVEEMTNYEGYYPDESSDGEVSEPSSGTNEHHHKSFDSVVFHVLKVSPEDFASQLTLLDLAAFREIQPQELTGCGWIKKDKHEIAPNVVQMTQRFNNTSFYVVHEVLHAQTLKIRAEVVTHFIRIAKKLNDLNNLHSLMAVVMSLSSAPIHRLTKTWGIVNKHYRATFDRLRILMSEENNRMNLRKHIEGIKLPCIPYLGLYLGDLIFVDSAHPDTGGLEPHERTNKMNNILRILAEFQQSQYDNLREIPHIKNFLQSVKYIEELQRFVEDDNYKRSLKIEPKQSNTPHKGLNASREELALPTDHTLPRRSMTPPTQQLFKPGHRKSHSLGRDIRPRTDPAKLHKRRSFARLKSRDFGASNGASPLQPPQLHRVQSSPDQSGSLPRSAQQVGPAHLPVVMTTSLLDDSIISPGAQTGLPSNSGSIGSSRSNSGSEFSDDTSWNGISASESRMDLGRILFEGCLRRKTVLKKGKKPPMPSWTKFWVCLHKSQLLFHSAKGIRANERHHFKQHPCKMIVIHEWMVLCSDDPSKLDAFQLSNPNQGDIYRFQCDSKEVAMVWTRRLQEAIKGNVQPEKDLINLHDT
ncbi:uncharacterized protein LOC120331408 isoform X1 [Styela clava]